MQEARFVTIGGGTGLSTLLFGLKRFTDEITAIVTMADDGGGSGRLRRETGILPPGDIRACLVALANTEPALENLLQYRYTVGDLKGQNFGNLLIASLVDIYGSFEEAVNKLSQVLKITGRVLPVTVDDINLEALMSNGAKVLGESAIPDYAHDNQVKIENLSVIPSDARVNQECIKAIEKADIIVLGPGSLYTSLIPNLRVKGLVEAIQASSAPLIYVSNIMTQKGETEDYGILDHLEALEAHGLKGRIQYIVVNTAPIDPKLLEKYQGKNASKPLEFNEEILARLQEKGIQVETGEFLQESQDIIRHSGLLLAQRLYRISDSFRGL